VFCGFGGTKWRCGKFPRESDGSQGGQHPLRRRFFFWVFFLDLFWGLWDLWVPVGWTGVPIREARSAGVVQFGVMGSGNSKDYLPVFGFPGKSTKNAQQRNEIMMIYLVQKRVTILLILPSTDIPDMLKV
jgi:hypothetical protein